MEIYLPPQILLILLLGGGLIFTARRHWVLPLFLALTVFVSMQFHVMVFGLNCHTVRILLLFAWARVLARGEHRDLQLVPMDRALILFCGSMVLVETLRRGLPGLIFSVAGQFYDALGLYFLGRVLLRGGGDIRWVIGSLAVICCVLAGFMAAERFTGHSFLKPLGAGEVMAVRDGKVRAQATFLHAVLAGTYGAVLLPLFVGCWWQGRQLRKVAVAGCLAATIMMVTANSGGPVMTYAAAVVGLCFWPLRFKMRTVRWVVLITLVGLHLVMKAPVWALITRITLGGSSYHRFNLLDAFIRHFDEWWFLGVEDTERWGWEIGDVANTYCIVAKHGGLLALVLFVRLLAAGFRRVGLERQEVQGDFSTEFMVWAFGAVLFGHVVTFLGTSYFDQTGVLWYFTLAMLASLPLLRTEPERAVEAFAAEEVPLSKAVECPLGNT